MGGGNHGQAASAAGARLVQRAAAGEASTELADGLRLPVIEVADTSDLTDVEAIYVHIQALQIVWTDSRGRLPWEPGYANPPGSQRLLGSLSGSMANVRICAVRVFSAYSRDAGASSRCAGVAFSVLNEAGSVVG